MRPVPSGLALFAAVFTLGACRGESLSTCFDAGLLVQAAAGGTLTVATADGGFSLTVPPGAFAQDTTVFASCTQDSVALEGVTLAGPAVTFSLSPTPQGPLEIPLQISLPFEVPAGFDVSQVFVGALESGGVHAVFLHGPLALDAADGNLAFSTLAVGTFGALAAPPCNVGADCTGAPSLSQLCLQGLCTGGLAGDVEVGCGEGNECLGNEPCSAGTCVGGFDGGGGPAPQSCLVDSDCPQTPTAEICSAGECVDS